MDKRCTKNGASSLSQFKQFFESQTTTCFFSIQKFFRRMYMVLFKASVAILAFLLYQTSTVFAQSTVDTSKLPASTRLALPGEKHRWLAPLVGTWNVAMRVWPAPGAQPIASNALVAKRDWILGGRYLREELQGEFAGNPSNRIAILSYNNLEERFELATMDTFEPGQMWYTSNSAATSSRINLHGDNVEAGFGQAPTGRKRALRFEFEIERARNVQRIYVKYPGQEEFLFVEQVFTPGAK
jgi:hypothetical protein